MTGTPGDPGDPSDGDGTQPASTPSPRISTRAAANRLPRPGRCERIPLVIGAIPNPVELASRSVRSASAVAVLGRGHRDEGLGPCAISLGPQVGDAVLGDHEVDVAAGRGHDVEARHDRRPLPARARSATIDRPPSDNDAAIEKSAWPPMPATTRPPTRSTLTAPSSPTCSAVLHATKRGIRARRPMSWVLLDGHEPEPAVDRHRDEIVATPEVRGLGGAVEQPARVERDERVAGEAGEEVHGLAQRAHHRVADAPGAVLHRRARGHQRRDVLADRRRRPRSA